MPTYTTAVDPSRVRAIDVHVHVENDGHGHLSLDQELMDASAAYFKHVDNRTPSVGDLAELYRELRMAAVVFTVDATTAIGQAPISSAQIAAECNANNDVLIPFGSVDPRTADAAIDLATELVEVHGVRGFKFHPSLQGFSPDDPAYQPLWSRIEQLRVPALFHTGQNGIGAGLPGGRGIKLRYSNPLLLDDVAADHPDLQVILAHPSVPWQAEAISMATHKSNVHIDLSGWRPRYFPPELVRAAGRQIRSKVLFGSDYPLIHPELWMSDAADLDWSEEARAGIYKENAAALLGLT